MHYTQLINMFRLAAKEAAQRGDMQGASMWHSGIRHLQRMYSDQLATERCLRDILSANQRTYRSDTAYHEAMSRNCRRAVQYLLARKLTDPSYVQRGPEIKCTTTETGSE